VPTSIRNSSPNRSTHAAAARSGATPRRPCPAAARDEARAHIVEALRRAHALLRRR